MAEFSVRPLRFLAIAALAVFLNGVGARASDEPTTQQSAHPTQISIERGAKQYQDNCASCHGAQADGDAASLVPALAGQRSIYLLKQLVAFTDSQRDSPEMHRRMAARALDSPRIWRDLAAYLSTLPTNGAPQTGDGTNLDRGKDVYRSLCIDCHGPHGEGRAAGAVPALHGQHYAYLAGQLRAFAGLHRDDMEFPLLQKIAALSAAQIDGVADYASRLPVDK